MEETRCIEKSGERAEDRLRVAPVRSSGKMPGVLPGALFLNKMKSRSGESIAETLVAVLIAALALLLLAGTINTASNLITKSKNLLDTYYTANNNLATEKTKTGTLTVTMQDNAGTSVSESWSVNYYQPAYDDDADTLGDTDHMMSYSIASTEESETEG